MVLSTFAFFTIVRIYKSKTSDFNRLNQTFDKWIDNHDIEDIMPKMKAKLKWFALLIFIGGIFHTVFWNAVLDYFELGMELIYLFFKN